jgi:hypothetical protein
VAEVARKVMGDAPIAYIEGAGGVRVAEDDLVAVGKNDVRTILLRFTREDSCSQFGCVDLVFQGWPSLIRRHHHKSFRVLFALRVFWIG